MTKTEQFSKLFCELEHCREDEQVWKIDEMNEMMDEMDEEEFLTVFTKELLNQMGKMIEEKTLSWGNAILLLKQAGYCKMLRHIYDFAFYPSLLGKRMKEMIFNENEKNEEKNEKLLTDLCVCYISLNFHFEPELLNICVPCLLNVALSKEETDEVQKEVEMALLCLSCIDDRYILRQELHLNKTKESILYHQEHRNLTKLAYQSAWQFLINRLHKDMSLDKVIINELHFGREAARELEELSRNVDWNRKKEEEMNKEEANEVLIIERWLETSGYYFLRCKLENEENVALLKNIVQVYRAAGDNNRDISSECTFPLRNAAENRVVKDEDLLKGDAIDAILEEMQRPTLNDFIAHDSLIFFMNVSIRLKEEDDDEKEKVKRKATKRKVLEKMEEEGYEDTITNFHEMFEFLDKKYYGNLSLSISDYLVNV
ncbi:uncharacterized protein MONOS_15148 [Monocercomonoides exilis]|uniref:uncharacterized protein n=1 Tax=Monocercomonoides exilis TaxID=2049356 RepID=UPI003559D6EF|nr:hypothetical protein MONOS_15148 [Monocercomonoides exilis]|eukprot:MONOS_15148.1-p1 / transcript=MONOS_15148.1 / gene=MONOS_15148 / organism=Monocercomonoides_exilis_PA203 / gene_product=unspecified product / transcript_product=unspecified product / location=Mono_scaffold01155:11003-12412(+) / protein_length=429 / sequence_SO=supercontig / SO=protein_coding / is_pseudo=false